MHPLAKPSVTVLNSSKHASATLSCHRSSVHCHTLFPVCPQGCRIDYVCVSPGLLRQVASCEVLGAETIPPKWSDHAAVVLELRATWPPEQGPSGALQSSQSSPWPPLQDTLLPPRVKQVGVD